MNSKFIKTLIIGLILSLSSFARAGIILDFTESDGDTIMTVSGTLDLTGFDLSNSGVWTNTSNGGGNGKYSQVVVGSHGPDMWSDSHGGRANFDLYTGNFNAGYTSNFTGNRFGIWNTFNRSNGNFQIDQNYASGTALFGQGTLRGWTLDELGVENTGLWLTMKNGETVSVTINGVDSSNVPEPSSLAIFALVLIGLASRRTKA